MKKILLALCILFLSFSAVWGQNYCRVYAHFKKPDIGGLQAWNGVPVYVKKTYSATDSTLLPWFSQQTFISGNGSFQDGYLAFYLPQGATSVIICDAFGFTNEDRFTIPAQDSVNLQDLQPAGPIKPSSWGIVSVRDTSETYSFSTDGNDTLAFAGVDSITSSNNVLTLYLTAGGGSGDITAVTAQAPITGGGLSGAVSIGADTTGAVALATQYDLSTLVPDSARASSQADTVLGGLAAAKITSGQFGDTRVANTISLDNMTQITTRNHSDLQNVGASDHHAKFVIGDIVDLKSSQVDSVGDDGITTHTQFDDHSARHETGGADPINGSIPGNAATATALAANGTNAGAGNAILGVDASGNAEGAFDVWTEAENTAAAYLPSAVFPDSVRQQWRWRASTGSSASGDTILVMQNGSLLKLDVGNLPTSGGEVNDDVLVNSTSATDANFNDSTPSAPANAVNVNWQISGSGPSAVSANITRLQIESVVRHDLLQGFVATEHIDHAGNSFTWGDNTTTMSFTWDPLGLNNPVLSIGDGLGNFSSGTWQYGGNELATTADLHSAVTLSTDLGNNLLGLSTQQLTLDNQSANLIFAGPSSGGDAAPSFRSLVTDDIPDLSGTYETETHASEHEDGGNDEIDLTDMQGTRLLADTLRGTSLAQGNITIDDTVRVDSAMYFNRLTTSRLIALDANNQAVSTITGANLNLSVSDQIIAFQSDNLGVFSATTSAQFRGVLSDESGTGVFLTTTGDGSGLSGVVTSESDPVISNLYDAQTILQATTDNNPAALTVTEQTVVGRLTGGNIAAVSLGIADNNIAQIDGTPNSAEYARFTASGLEGRTESEFKADFNLEADIDYPAESTFTTHEGDASAHHTKDATAPFIYTFNIELPSASEKTIFKFPGKAVNIDSARAVVVGSGSPSVTWNLRHGTDISAAGTSVFSSNQTTTNTTTGTAVTSGFTDNTLTNDEWLWIITTASNDDADHIAVTAFYSEN